MNDEHLKAVTDVLTRQHEFYAAKTAESLLFPIKLILSLNAAAIGASMLLVREVIGEEAQAIFLPFVKSAFMFFGAGLAFVLVAVWCQWRLYDVIMWRKRYLLKEALKENSWETSFDHFVNEGGSSNRTNWHLYSFLFTILSFIAFFVGAYALIKGL